MKKPVMQESGSVRKKDVAGLIQRIRRLREEKNFAGADELGEFSIKEYPSDADLLSEHADTAVRRKSWSTATKRLKRLIRLRGPVAEGDEDVLKLVAVYVGLGQPGEAESVLNDALAGRPQSLALRKAAAELELLDPERRFDGEKWRLLAATPGLDTVSEPAGLAVIAACVAGLRLAGHAGEAKTLLGKHFHTRDSSWDELLKDGYARLVIFDNGRTRVEFYTKLFDPATGALAESGRLVVTFDVMEQTWDKEPFGYRPLSPGPNDLLAVRKRTKDDFHQELRRDDFLRFAGPVAARYSDVVAIGQSLGAYSALYYASWLPGCRILATAPRNPLHPVYASKRYASYKLFVHEYEMLSNGKSNPTIVYDPKNAEDAKYVEQSLAPRFPNAIVIAYPNCGHSITRYLRDVGALKNATLGFCEGIPFPPFDRTRRGGSSEYLRNLARRSLRDGRRNRALAFARRALELGQETERTRELLAKISMMPEGV